jgi:hypothetical protein
MFRLLKAETIPLTKGLAEKFQRMPASPTERELNPLRIKGLKLKAELGHLITFNWAMVNFGKEQYRMNGQHSSAMLLELEGPFPDNLFAHVDTYEIDSQEDLASLFRQFDNRISSRSEKDVAGAYQGLWAELHTVPKPNAKLAAEGVALYLQRIEKSIGKLATSDDKYAVVFNLKETHPFIIWMGELLTTKTPELRYASVIAAIYATYQADVDKAVEFWTETARGGAMYINNAPTFILSEWLRKYHEHKNMRQTMQPLNYYQGCIWAWNNFMKGKTIKDVIFDIKKGVLAVEV